jgi:uncharacterized coiled-coil protein SlyX
MALNKQQLEVVNQTNFPDNNTQLITPALLRDFNTDMIDAIQLTGSYATTGSNTFVGNQTITGNLNVSGVISASVLYVQTETASVIYSSGSNQLGDELTDIQTLSGSVRVQGSLTVNGTPVLTSSADLTGFVTTSSFNAYTQSANQRLTSLETNSASVNVSITNLNQTTASLNTSVTNINQFTQSQAALNGTFATTGSNTFTGNQIIDRASKLYTNGIYWTDVTAGFNNLEIINQGGGNLDLAALNGGKVRIVNTPLVLTGSALSSSNDISTSANVYGANLTGTISSSAQISALGFVSSSVTASSLITASLSGQTLTFTKGDSSTFGIVLPDVSGSDITALNAFTASQLTINTGYNTFTQSANTSISNLNAATASYVTETESGSFLLTASFDNNTRDLTFTKGNNTTFAVNIPDVSGSTINTGSFATTASFNSYTQSNDQRVTALEVNSASVNTSIANINTTTASLNSSVTQLNASSASQQVSIDALNTNSASVNTSITNINSATASLFTSASLAIVTASVNNDDITFTKGDGSQFTIQVATGSFAISASYAETASYAQFATDIYLNVKNTTGAQLNKGTVVRIIGATGDNALIQTASWTNDANSANTLGLLYENIANDGFGKAITQGTLLGIDTDPTLGYTAGQLLYLSSSGQYTNVKPGAPYHEVRLGQVLRAQQNNGSMYVLIQNGYELDELHDVDINTGSLANNDLLAWDSASQQWENKTVSGVGATTTSSFNSYTASNDQKVNSLISATGSYVTSAITASSLVTASVNLNTITFTKGDGTTFPITVNTGSGGGTTDTGSLMVTGSVAGNVLTFTKGDGSTFDLTVSSSGSAPAGTVSSSAQILNYGIFATTGSNTFRGTQTIATGDLVMGNGFEINSPSGAITNLSAANTIQFITEGAAGPGGTNDIKFINRVTGSRITFDNNQAGAGNLVEFIAGAVSFDIGARSGSTGKVTFGSNTTAIEALNTPIVAQTLRLTGPLTASLTQGYVWAGGVGDVSTLVATSSFTINTGSFATTGSNTFTGDQTLIDNAGNFFTISDASGSMMLVAKGFTSASLHLSASAAGIGNFIFKTNSNTADTIISGSGNIFVNGAAPTAGFKRYIGGSNNIFNTTGLPQISGSMAFSPTMTGNIGTGTYTFRGPVSSSAWSILNNYNVGTINTGTTAVNNAEKLTSGLALASNTVLSFLNIIANQSALTGSTTTLSNNLVVGTAILQLSSSAATMAGNIINDNNFTFTNQFYSSSVGLGSVALSRNNIAGQSNSIIVVGAQPAGTTTGTSFSDNFMGGGGNIIYGDIANARVSGSTAYHNAIRNMVFGNGLIITGSSLLADANSYGSAFFGRYNSTDGNKDLTNETIFAVGTGNATTRKTGFLIDSGSNTFIEGTLNVSGSTTMTGSLILSSSAAVELQVIGGSEFTGSMGISQTLQLGQLDPLPSGADGQLAVSASNLYFYSGSAWNKIAFG